MSHYVYQHIRKDNGLPFYVGMGRGRRAWHKAGNRSKWWARVAHKAGKICQACKGQRPGAYGYTWKYKDDK